MQRKCAKLFGMPVSSPSVVRTLAHPLRARLYHALRDGGPATATLLAAALGTNSGATSYHLRKLAEVGVVADVPHGTVGTVGTVGRGRDRVWQALPVDRSRTGEAGDAPDVDDLAALDWIDRDYVRHVADQADRWLDAAPHWPTRWRDRLGMTDAAVLVTSAQLGAMREEIAEVVSRYRRVGQGNPTAKRVAVYVNCFPVDSTPPLQP